MKTKTDLQLKKDVEEELRWDPRINEAKVGVTVDQGAVTLLGTVDTYAEKWAAEEAAKRVGGVCSLAMDLTVKILGEHVRSDTEIAVAVRNAIEWDVLVPKSVRAQVKDGWVTVQGEVNVVGYEHVPLQRRLDRVRDLGVVPLMGGQNLDVQVLSDGVNAIHAFGSGFGGPLLRVRIDRARQGDRALVDAHANLRGVELRIPAKLFFHVFLQL